MYAFAPYQEGNPPPPKAELDATILLMYPPSEDYFPNWSPCDQWEGATWLTAGEKSAVFIAGRKALGETYYGAPRPQDCGGGKGYHCPPYETQFLIYDPDELSAVARGEKSHYNVLPYAILRPRDYLWPTCSADVGGAAFDRERGYLYIVQTALGERPIVHVFGINGGGSPVGDVPGAPSGLVVNQ
jgi:hypothetical protein